MFAVTPTFGPHPLYCQYTAADEPETALPKKKARLSSDKNSHSILQLFTPSSSSRDDSQPVILDLSDELISSDSDSDTENGDVPQ